MMFTYRLYGQQTTLVCRRTFFRHWYTNHRLSPLVTWWRCTKTLGILSFFFFFKPWLLPHLNRCLSLEASTCYHRQYCISPYNILLHSTEPRWFINVRAKANMLCVLLELHKCLKSGWVGFGCWSGENRDAWERLAGVLFPAWPQKSFFCSPWKNNWVNILKCLLNGAY